MKQKVKDQGKSKKIGRKGLKGLKIGRKKSRKKCTKIRREGNKNRK